MYNYNDVKYPKNGQITAVILKFEPPQSAQYDQGLCCPHEESLGP